MIPLSGRQFIERLLGQGYTPEEAAEAVHLPLVVDRDGEVIYNTPPGRRRLVALIAEIAGVVTAAGESDHWRELEAAYVGLGGRPRQSEVADKCHVSVDTLRRWYRDEPPNLSSWQAVQARIGGRRH